MPALARWAVGCAVLAGLVLRFATTSHLWLDEALSVDIARLPLGDIGAALRHDGHPPLYYWLLHTWMAVFGEGDVAVRALSGVLAVAALPLAWIAGRRAAGPSGGWWALGLFALCPILLRYGTETRMYALATLLVLGGWLLVRRALEVPTTRRLVPVALTSGALLLTHYWSLWLTAATVVVLSWHARHSNAARRVRLAVVAGGILLLPWLPSMLDQAAHTGTPWAGAVRPTTMVTTSLNDIGGGDYAEATLLGFGLLALFAVGIAGRTSGPHTLELDERGAEPLGPEAAVVGLTLAIASAAGYATGTTFASRYVAVLIPLFLLVGAAGAARLPGRVTPPVALAAVLVFGAVGGVHNVVTDRTQAGVIADAIRHEGRAGDVVVICPDQLGPAVHRVLPDDLVQLTYPTSAIGPARVDWRDYASRNAASDPSAVAADVTTRSKSAHNVWVVWSGSYRTLEGQCEALVADLGASLGTPTTVVVEDGDEYFEHAQLTRFAGLAPP
jgi:hypothetical protein